ncbi:MAG: [FeFe] hydrogenase H-cluster maturation GTPase HydF [Ruminococcus sp.]|nr:[FeFe] hydrogenase H-cluster maturation GTPase HydF [Ruminococcus sp.]
MSTTLNDTPLANRLHIGFYGKRNSGKSSLINAFTGQEVSIVSEVAGTTTDPVNKAMEIHGIGACVLIDTAGFDDIGELGEMRIKKTEKTADKTDIAIVLFSGDDITKECEWYELFKSKNIPVIPVVSKADLLVNGSAYVFKVRNRIGEKPLQVSAVDRSGIDELKEQIIRLIPSDYNAPTITGSLCEEGDLIMLVMPQDIQAPKGRLILPQVQTIRELLDKKCSVMSCTTDKMIHTLSTLSREPKLIITDSQVFSYVYENKPESSMLTSFSVLFAAYKGDLTYYIEGAKALDSLTENSHILIAECCTHAPLSEDIGRIKIPRLLRKRVGESLRIDMVSGTDFPEDLSGYDLIIQCGGCMFNRQYIMTRIDKAKAQKVPMTNYGVTIAHLTGILDKIVTP